MAAARVGGATATDKANDPDGPRPSRRWQIDVSWRYRKSELALESPRLWKWERRQKPLLLATLAYAFLLSSLRADHVQTREWLLRY